MRTTKRLPKKFWPYFWDNDPVKIGFEKKSSYIIERLLDKGSLEAIRWVRRNYDTETIKEALVKRRDFRPAVANFWRLFLKIPKDQVLCLQTPYQKVRKMHWPY